MRTAALVCLALATVLFTSGCDRNADAAPKPAALSGMELRGDFGGSGPGTLKSANTLPTIDRRIRAATSLAARITYTSTSGISDGPTEVSGAVFVPRGNPPEGGWPVVAVGHPTTGILPECGPSLYPTLLNSALTVTSLVHAGYVVAMSDYQGLGLNQTYHPYLDSTTAGYNLIDSVRAARKLVPQASDRYLTWGISQGGQAAWAANELQQNYGAGVTLVGTVSVSPPTDITGFADAAAAGTLTREQQPAMQWLLAALKNAYPDLNLDDYRYGIVRDKWEALAQCKGSAVDARTNIAQQITADDLRPDSPQAVATLRGYLQKMSLPQGPTAAPMLVIYGGMDTLIPEVWTDRALDQACRMGDVIDIRLQPDKGHGDFDPSTAVAWADARFKGDPALNSCQSVMAGRESVGESG